ncbi:MAG: amino acid permease [Propionibacteriaceae bacterium]
MAPATESGLKRQLSALDVAVMGIAGALGTGLFLGSRDVLALAGPAAMLSYAFTAALVFIVMIAMGELTAAHPEPGGFGASSARYLGIAGGFIVRWNIAICCCIAVGAELIAATGYIRIWLPGLSPVAIAVALSALIVAMNFMAVSLYGKVETVMTIVKVAVVVIFILLGVCIITSRQIHGAQPLSNLTTGGGFFAGGALGFFQGAIVAMFSFGGMESASIAAAESADPARTIPRAFRIMIVTIVAADVLAIAVITTMSPWTQTIAKQPGVSSSPFVDVLGRSGIPAADTIMIGVLIIAALSAALGLMYGASRLLYSLGTDGFAPRALASANHRGVPVKAVMFSSFGMVIAVLLALFRPHDAFEVLLGVLIISLGITWIMVLLTHLQFRKQHTPMSGFRLRGAPVTTYVALIMLVVMTAGLWTIPSMRIAIYWGVPYAILLCSTAFIIARRRSHNVSE